MALVGEHVEHSLKKGRAVRVFSLGPSDERARQIVLKQADRAIDYGVDEPVVAKYSFPAQFRVGVGGRSADARRMTDATKVRVEGPSDEGAGGLGRPRATAVLGQSRSAQVQSHDALTLRMFSEIRAGRSSTDGGSSPKRGGHFGELG